MAEKEEQIFSLEGKKILITGASKGIGAATALSMAKLGADLILVARDVPKLERVCDTVRSMGRNCSWCAADVSDENQRGKIFQAVEAFGGIDCYVNNAAFTRFLTPMQTGKEDIDDLFGTNFKGAFLLAQKMAEFMIPAGGGSIVFVTSINAISALPSQAMYSCTKAALESLVKSFAAELAKYKIRVNSVAPGAVITDMNSHFTQEKIEELSSKIPLGHVGEPDEIGDVIAFLCSNAARYITGTTVVVDGGYLLRK